MKLVALPKTDSGTCARDLQICDTSSRRYVNSWRVAARRGVQSSARLSRPCSRHKAHLGILASPIGNADARAAAARRVAVIGDGRALRASRADHLATAANRIDSLLGGYDLATLEDASARANKLMH